MADAVGSGATLQIRAGGPGRSLTVAVKLAPGRNLEAPTALLHFRSSRLPRRPSSRMQERGCCRCSWPWGEMLDHDCGVRGIVRLSSTHREDVPVCRTPSRRAFPLRAWCPFRQRAGRRPSEKNGSERRDINPFWNQYLTSNQKGLSFTSACLPNTRRVSDIGILPGSTTCEPRRVQVDQDARWGQTPKRLPIGP